MRIIMLALLGLLAQLGVSFSAGAATIYNNGGPDTYNGYSIFSVNEAADDFRFSSAASVTSVGFYFQTYPGINGWDQVVNYNFYSDVSGSPGTLLASGTAQNVAALDSGLPWCCGGNAWLVTFDLQTPFLAAANTNYWLGLTGAGSTIYSAWWVTSGYPGNGHNGSNINAEFAFYLDGSVTSAVPEPSTWAMMLLGFAGVGLTFRAARSSRPNKFQLTKDPSVSLAGFSFGRWVGLAGRLPEPALPSQS